MLYELTLTLKPVMYKHEAQQQYDMLKESLLNILSGYKVTLVCELTGENNVHYHGVIELKDHRTRDKFLNRFRSYGKIFGRKTCSQLIDEPAYIKYISKDLSVTYDVLARPPILTDAFGYLVDVNVNCIDHYLESSSDTDSDTTIRKRGCKSTTKRSTGDPDIPEE